ncbi:hypothetical protein TRVA0_053S00364 [Trichomonascus vanleenenianus]|uniref:OPA3 family protein n=1 Tax=Trichomonascus vanleenenianus TaxID=2268995 RepID=UPI003ECAF928
MSSIALKFTSLLVRTVSKPIANGIKGQAKQHPRFRKACISFAQFLHRTDVKLRMSLLGEKNLRIRPLNDAKAIDMGATFLSESFIFSVAGGLILFESYRSHKKEVARREGVADDIQALQGEIEWLRNKLEEKRILNSSDRIPEDLTPPQLLAAKPKEEPAVGPVEPIKPVKPQAAAVPIAAKQ